MRSPFSSASPTSAITAAAPRRSKRRWSSSHSAPQDTKPATLYALVLSANFDPADRKYGNQLKRRRSSSRSSSSSRNTRGRALPHPQPRLSADRTTGSTRRGESAGSRLTRRMLFTCLRTSSPGSGRGKSPFESNRESARVVQKPRAARTQPADCTTYCAMDYMVYAHLQLGQDRQAREIIDQMRASRASAEYPHRALRAGRKHGALRGRAERLESRGGARGAPTRFAYVDAIRISPARSAQRARAGRKQREADIAKLAELRDRLRAAKDAYWAEQVEIQWLAATAWLLHAERRHDEALSTMSRAADAEDKTESPSSRPDLLRPPRELYGAMLLERGMLHDALAAFEATLVKAEPLQRVRGRCEAAERLGDQAKAKRLPSNWPRWRAAPRETNSAAATVHARRDRERVAVPGRARPPRPLPRAA